MPEFVIVTIEGPTYREGQTASTVPALAEIGASEQVLDSFVYASGDVVLRFGNYQLRIPQTRIDHIARHA